MVYEIQEGEPVPPALPLVMSTTDEWLARISDQLDQLLNPASDDEPAAGETTEVVLEEPATPEPAAPGGPVVVEEPADEKPRRLRRTKK